MVQALCMKFLSSWLHERNFFKDHGGRQAGLGSTGAIMLMKSPCLSHSHTHLILAVLYTHVLDTPPPFFFFWSPSQLLTTASTTLLNFIMARSLECPASFRDLNLHMSCSKLPCCSDRQGPPPVLCVQGHIFVRLRESLTCK